MPSTLPSDAWNKSQSMRKPERPNRRMTTLSFEQIDRRRNRIFTENISAASRLPRPAYVVREADVIGANMPDTIKLSKHRSKIYVGLTDTTSSGHSSHRSLATTNRERTSTATSVLSKASIIDWTDTGSEISAPTGLSGEFSAILPPVTATKNSISHPPPGLDTAEIFNYRSVIHKKRTENRSPRPPPSRGGVPRPPHNTPFPTLNRPDEFAATFRKRVTPRKTPLENCNVVLIGGSITPQASSSNNNDNHRSRTTVYREPSFLDHRKIRRESHQVEASYVGLPRFDLPVIDLKCVESPVSNLGDLEEKGIRLVKLRRVKRRKKKDSVLPNSDKAGDKSSHEAGIVSIELNAGPTAETDIIHTYRSTESIPLSSNRPTDRKESNEPETDLKKSSDINVVFNGPETKRQESTLTTPSTVDEKEKDEKTCEELGALLSNREPYSTPLLPDVDTTPRAENPPTSDDLAKESIRIQLTMEQTGNTPAPTPLTPVEQLPSEEDVLIFENERGHSKRFQKRSSSLLTVPDSICLSERRPVTHDELSPQNEVDKELQKIMDDGVDDHEQTAASQGEEISEGRKSVTVATQTSP